jgi:hypothetical protein
MGLECRPVNGLLHVCQHGGSPVPAFKQPLVPPLVHAPLQPLPPVWLPQPPPLQRQAAAGTPASALLSSSLLCSAFTPFPRIALPVLVSNALRAPFPAAPSPPCLRLNLLVQIYSERKGKHTQPPVSLRCTASSLRSWHATAMPSVHAHCSCPLLLTCTATASASLPAGGSCCGGSSSPSAGPPSPTLTAWLATPSASRHGTHRPAVTALAALLLGPLDVLISRRLLAPL